VDSIAVDGYRSSRFSGIIDTGSRLVVGDPLSVAQFYHAIPGSKDASSTVGPGYYTGLPLFISAPSIPVNLVRLWLSQSSL
jgi:hypothetical protein